MPSTRLYSFSYLLPAAALGPDLLAQLAQHMARAPSPMCRILIGPLAGQHQPANCVGFRSPGFYALNIYAMWVPGAATGQSQQRPANAASDSGATSDNKTEHVGSNIGSTAQSSASSSAECTDEAAVAWARAVAADVQPLVAAGGGGLYLLENMHDEEGTARRCYEPPALQRLLALKARADPQGLLLPL